MLSSFKYYTTFALASLVAASPIACHQTRDTCSASWGGTSIAGASDGGACRYSVRYGAADRWEDAVVSTQT